VSKVNYSKRLRAVFRVRPLKLALSTHFCRPRKCAMGQSDRSTRGEAAACSCGSVLFDPLARLITEGLADQKQ
jgi:hypothetical protein